MEKEEDFCWSRRRRFCSLRQSVGKFCDEMCWDDDDDVLKTVINYVPNSKAHLIYQAL